MTCEREVRFRYDQREAGVVAIGESSPRWGGLEHALVYGADASRLKTDERREGRQTNLNTGHVSNVVGGEALPMRDFPLTDTDRFGVFAQDRFTALDTRLTWIPGLRYDYYRLRPEVDELFRAGNPLRPVVGLTDAAWSPKLGLLFRASDPWTLTAQLSTGFRGPPAADLNIGLTSLPAGYTVIPNPDLKPERLDREQVPPMLLQTLVENAVRHGIAPLVGGGELTITAERVATGLQLVVRNIGHYTPGKAKGSGIGLQNTRSRLTMLYADQASFDIVNVDVSRGKPRSDTTAPRHQHAIH